jgi:hypothetical protein
MTLPSLVLLTSDAIGERMAGPAIRTVELARVLAGAGHPVTIIGPAIDGAVPDGVEAIEASGDDALRSAVTSVDPDVVLGFSAVIADHPWLAETGIPLVVDAYDPGLLETIERFRGAPVNEQRDWLAAARHHMVDPLSCADLVLVASERQRHLVLGMLAAGGRINARTATEDPTLRALCAVVPFGLAADPPVGARPGPLRGGPDPLPADAVVALWGGGLYDWLDPLTLVDAVAHCPDERVVAVFLAGPHPTAAVGPQALVDRARARAADLGVLGTRVRFVEQWVPYQERGAWLRDADIGVSLHLDHVETTFAFRTRILDYFWAGLPVVCSAGDHMAELVAAHDLGIVVPVGDADAVGEALGALASSPASVAAARRERTAEVARAHEWTRASEPLLRWCAAPRLAADRRLGAEEISLRRRVLGRLVR